MIPLDHRQRLVRDIDQAHRVGARLRPACEVAGIDVRTLQRWRSTGLAVQADQRKHCQRPTPAHALTQQERQEILRVANEPRFADMPPSRIVPMLANEGPLYRQRIELCTGDGCCVPTDKTSAEAEHSCRKRENRRA